MSLSEPRRTAYLDALGITQWVRRRGWPAPAVAPEIGGDQDFGVEDSVAPREEAYGTSAVDAMDWDALQRTVAECRRCSLCETRTHTVFGVGNREAELLVVGEAPGEQEDLEGEPFVGRAGMLLTNMLRAIGLAREQVYIANVLKCRPPANRDPRPDEAQACQAYLDRQIALIRPRAMLLVGRIAAQHLLQTEAPVGRLRGAVHRLPASNTPVVVTYHPAYLLRRPEDKRKAWDDLKLALRVIRDERGT